LPCDTTEGSDTLTVARPPGAFVVCGGCCWSVTVRGGRTKVGIGAAATGSANRSRCGGGGAKTTYSRGRGGKKNTGGGGGGAKPGPSKIMTGRSTKTTSVGGGGAMPKSK
jgi:hypothetical protein